MSITVNREAKAYEKIDLILENQGEHDGGWFLTMEDLENRIKKDINKYYEFCLYILESCTPATAEEKAVYKELSDFVKLLSLE